MAEAIQGVKNCTMRWAEKLVAAGIIIDSHSCMFASSFTGNEIPVGEVNKQASLPIGWIRKTFGAIRCLVRITNHCARMCGRFWRWLLGCMRSR